VETGDLLHAIRIALDTTFVGPAAGYITAIWGVIRVTLPVIREWIASRREDGQPDDRKTPSFRLAYEYAVKQNIENHETWENERTQLLSHQSYLMAEIESLKKQLKKMAPVDEN
jgi:hypothetical protein